MTLQLADTIAAIASAPGGALRAIVRLSGPRTVEVVSQSFTPADELPLSQHRRALLCPGQLRLSSIERSVACDLYLWPTERSYTREPLAELHLPGARPLAEAALAMLGQQGVRLARPGEFTMRAFLAGRLDLTQAEAVLGVIDAADAQQLDVALRQLAGGLGQPLHALREQLLNLLAHVEAGLDFVEEDIEFIGRADLLAQLTEIAKRLEATLQQAIGRDAGAALPRVVLLGSPNAGKSSLFNALLERSQAIVSAEPGTTRDYLSGRLPLPHGDCELIDTAGLESLAEDSPRRRAQLATSQQGQQADLALVCHEAGTPLDAASRQWLAAIAPQRRLLVWTKSDRLAGPLDEAADLPASAATLFTSSQRGDGLTELREAIDQQLMQLAASGESLVVGTAIRARESLLQARRAIAAAVALVQTQQSDELTAIELRSALDALGEVVGVVYTDDLLDRIFSRFCIGK